MKKAGKRTLKRTGKYVILGVILLVVVLLLPHETGGPPELVITVNGQVVYYKLELSSWDNMDPYYDGMEYDRLTHVQYIVRLQSDKVSYVPLGGMVTIEFKGTPPEKFRLYEELVDKEGTYYDSSGNIAPKFKDGIISFEFKANSDAFLWDVPEETVHRGFLLGCEFEPVFDKGSRNCLYIFVVKTDSGDPRLTKEDLP